MRVVLVFIMMSFCSSLFAQSYAFGVKGGAVIGTQQWDSFDRDFLLGYHGIAFIESAPEGNQFALFAQAGYHQRGSAIRGRNAFIIDQSGTPRILSGFSQKFIFTNVSLVIGAKRKYEWNNNYVYYALGLRGEYTIGTNLDEYRRYVEAGYLQYPFEEAVNKINYGVLAGGGIEFPFTELISGIVELTINPDLSLQYNSPPFEANVPATGVNPGGLINVQERRISNTSLELTVGMRFMHKIIYVD